MKRTKAAQALNAVLILLTALVFSVLSFHAWAGPGLEKVNSIEIGKTTQKKVESILGVPSRVWVSNERTRWNEAEYRLVNNREVYSIRISFNRDSVVKNIVRKKSE